MKLIITILTIIIILKVITIYLGKYRNPYTFTFIFGKKGSSKSTLLCSYMLKYLRKGWTIYTDMPVNIPNVRIIQDADDLFKKYTPEPHSVILLDEIGITWHKREFKTFDKKIREWFKFERKYKCRVIANSQDFDIDAGLRVLTDEMILQTNLFGCIGWSRPIIRKITLTNPEFTGESKIVDALVFGSIFTWRFIWIPKYQKYFESFAAPERPYMPYKLALAPTERDLKKLHCSKRVRRAILSQYASTQALDVA